MEFDTKDQVLLFILGNISPVGQYSLILPPSPWSWHNNEGHSFYFIQTLSFFTRLSKVQQHKLAHNTYTATGVKEAMQAVEVARAGRQGICIPIRATCKVVGVSGKVGDSTSRR